MPKLGTMISDTSKIEEGPAPVVIAAQVDGHIPLESPEDIKQWEEDVMAHYGIEISASRLGITPSTTCCGGRADDCGGAF